MTGLLIFRIAAPYLLKFMLQRLTKNMQPPQTKTPKPPKNEASKDLGEYIEYEEVD